MGVVTANSLLSQSPLLFFVVRAVQLVTMSPCLYVRKSAIGCPTLLKPLANFTLIQDHIIYEKILDIRDFQNLWPLFTIRKLSQMYEENIRKFDNIIFLKINIYK